MGTQTIHPVPGHSSTFLSALQTFLAHEDAQRQSTALPDYIVSGGVGPTSVTLAHTIPAVVGYVSGYYVSQAAVTYTYTASRRVFVYLHQDDALPATVAVIGGNGADFEARVGHFLFVEADVGSVDPDPIPDATLLMVVDTDATTIATVTSRKWTSPLHPYALNVEAFPSPQAAIDAVPPTGGRVVFPAGTYRLTAALTCTDKPLVLEGAGPQATVLIQETTGANGLTFTSTTALNAVVGSNIRKHALTVRGLSLQRGDGTTGGAAIRGIWEPATDNKPYCCIEDVLIEPEVYGDDSWAYGLHLTNVNGSRLTDVTVRGDANATFSTVDPTPFALTAGILLDSAGTAAGKINHYWNGITVSWANTGIAIAGWYEGIYGQNFEIVQVGTGLSVLGDTTFKNPNLLLSQLHMDVRQNGIVAERVINLWLQDADCYKAGGVLGLGFTGTLVTLTDCLNFQYHGGKVQNIHSAPTNGILTDAFSLWGSVTGVLFSGINQSALALLGSRWSIGPNRYDGVGTALFISGQQNVIALQQFGPATVLVNNSGTGNYIQTQQFLFASDVTLTGGTPTEDLSLAIPAGIFGTVPFGGIITFAHNSSLIAHYLPTDGLTTATNARVRVRTVDGLNIVGGVHRLNYLFY
jgi:hypothetical protein